jgi:hypothetical protein
MVIACEHGFVHRYPLQESDEVVSGLLRVVRLQQPAFGESPETGCQRGEDALEALLIPTAAQSGQSGRRWQSPAGATEAPAAA